MGKHKSSVVIVKIIFTILFCYLNQSDAKAQNISVSGIIRNSQNRTIIPYASIKVSNNNIGTSSNTEGKFKINIPHKLLNEFILISYLGFKLQKIKIDKINTIEPLVINLEPMDISLNEVTITKESASQIVYHAYRNKNLNYPITNTLYTGFFRESNFYTDPNSIEHYNYVIEAILKINKKSYAKKVNDDEDLKIENSRKNTFPNADTTLKWYAGAYTPLRFDIVAKDFAFLNPRNSSDYIYVRSANTSYYDEPVYVINFTPRNKGKYKGILYINTNTYALVKADFELSPEELSNRNLLKAAKITSRVIKVNYQPIGKTWYLQSVWQQAVGKENFSQHNFRFVTEYATTKIDTNYYEKFKYGDKLFFEEVLSSKTLSSDTAFWKSYNIVSETQLLKDLLIDTLYRLQISQNVDQTLYKKNYFLKIRSKIQQKLKPVLIIPSFSHIKTNQNVSLQYTPLENINIVNQIIKSKNNNVLFGFGYGFSYELNKNFFLRAINIYENGTFRNNVNDLGLNYQTNLSSPANRPVSINIGVNYSFSSIRQRLNNYQPTSSLTASQKQVLTDTFFQKSLKINLLSRQQFIAPLLGLNIELNKVLTAFMEGSYLINVRQSDAVELIERSSNVFKKIFPNKQEVDLSSPYIILNQNNHQISKYPFASQFNIRAGLRGYIRFRH